MRIKICEFGTGARNESRYFVEKDEDTGELYYVHEWHNSIYGGPADEGERRILLSKASEEPYYDRAIIAAQKL